MVPIKKHTYLSLKVLLTILLVVAIAVSCGKKKKKRADNNNGDINRFGAYPTNRQIINDSFTPVVSQVLSQTQCPDGAGRLQLSLSAPVSQNYNNVFGPLTMGGNFTGGAVVGAFIGVNPNGGVIVLRKLGSSSQVTGYHIELHLCKDNSNLVDGSRQLNNFQFCQGFGINPWSGLPEPVGCDPSGLSTSGMVLINIANCSVGHLVMGPATLDALPNGRDSQSRKVATGNFSSSNITINSCPSIARGY